MSGISGLLSALSAAASTAASSAAQIVQGQNVSVTNFSGYAGTMSALNSFAASADSWLLPTGLVMPFAGTGTPSGWLLCNGSQISRSTYADLYAVFGPNAFGTDTDSLFYLPDLRGRTLIGVGTAASGASLTGVRGVVQGANGGTQALSASNLPTHTHSISGSGNTGGESNDHSHGGTTGGESGHTHTVNMVSQGDYAAGSNRTGLRPGGSYGTAGALATHTHPFTTGGVSVGHTHSWSFSGTSGSGNGLNGDSFNIVQPSFALNYFVKT